MPEPVTEVKLCVNPPLNDASLLIEAVAPASMDSVPMLKPVLAFDVYLSVPLPPKVMLFPLPPKAGEPEAEIWPALITVPPV